MEIPYNYSIHGALLTSVNEETALCSFTHLELKEYATSPRRKGVGYFGREYCIRLTLHLSFHLSFILIYEVGTVFLTFSSRVLFCPRKPPKVILYA